MKNRIVDSKSEKNPKKNPNQDPNDQISTNLSISNLKVSSKCLTLQLRQANIYKQKKMILKKLGHIRYIQTDIVDFVVSCQNCLSFLC